jgi:hypothetical protein
VFIQQTPYVIPSNKIKEVEVSMQHGWADYKSKITVFWDIRQCSFVEVDRRFRDMYCLHHDHYETTRRHIPEACKLYTRRRENLISQIKINAKFWLENLKGRYQWKDLVEDGS